MALGLHKVHIRGFQSGVGLARGLRSGRQLLVLTLRASSASAHGSASAQLPVLQSDEAHAAVS